MRKWIIYIVIAALILSGGGWLIMKRQSAQSVVSDQPTETAAVQRGDLIMSVEASGSLTPRIEVSLAFTAGGRVAEALIAEGQSVEADQPLLRLDTTELEWQVEQSRLSVSIAEYDLSDVRDDYWEESVQVKRAKAKLEQAQVSLQQAEWRLEQATLTAPISGTVTALLVDAGEIVNNGQTVIVVSSIDTLQAEINLDETDVARIAIGAPVAITVDAFPGTELSGEVTDISPSASIQSGVVLYPVTVRLNATDPSTGFASGQALPLRPGMTANVTIIVEKRENTLIVPFRAVETEGGRAFVTLQTTAGSQRVPVTLGLITDMQIEILSGVSEGDVVAVYANPVQDNSLQMRTPFSGGQ
jgi:membrane fusion protein (multidrug efflux system)